MPRNEGGISRKERYVKAVRAKAHQEGTVFKTALASMRHDESVHNLPRIYGSDIILSREARRRASSIKPSEDEGVFELRDEDVYDFKVDFDDSRDIRHYTNMTVSLFDIARPAKGKGAAKDFEMVNKTRNVIPLDAGDFEIWEDDVFDRELWGDWEEIYDEQRVDKRRSYSSVLRGNER
ncbi:hypothetical protein M413DRAFT_449304 [Hebeloma cylindrosporum]|uniref:Uncharacterized protein n=1 Tax=Hebeloma cylindrosporum TaxID=76867 RepID=A0A0C3BHQ4_HEBCY|nr:hypothetical protein M413DRAFT_449304 [Hebeloma cylindrosporum h7]